MPKDEDDPYEATIMKAEIIENIDLSKSKRTRRLLESYREEEMSREDQD